MEHTALRDRTAVQIRRLRNALQRRSLLVVPGRHGVEQEAQPALDVLPLHLSGHAVVAGMMVVEWVFVFWIACFFLRAIPAVDRWMVQLCVVDAPGPGAPRSSAAHRPASGADSGSDSMRALADGRREESRP